MKRVDRKNSLFVGNPRGGRTAAILASLTSSCRRHDVDPQLYSMQGLVTFLGGRQVISAPGFPTVGNKLMPSDAPPWESRLLPRRKTCTSRIAHKMFFPVLGKKSNFSEGPLLS
jgi:hypothetical protein